MEKVSLTIHVTFKETVAQLGTSGWTLVDESPGSSYFDMSVWDADVGSDDLMLTTQSFSVNPGYHRDLVHCGTDSCSAKVYFDYNLIPDGNECSPNPCVRGTCIDLISADRCNCPTVYGKTRYEFISERLRVYVRYGRNLPDIGNGMVGLLETVIPMFE